MNEKQKAFKGRDGCILMGYKEVLLKELVKRGYEEKDGKKIWNLADRSLLHGNERLSKAFLELTKHPRYKRTVVEIEKKLIREHAKSFAENFGEEPFNLIDMGCGDGGKAIEFIESLGGKGKIRYWAISPGGFTPKIALENIKKKNFGNVVELKSHNARLNEVGDVAGLCRGGEFQRNVILLFGSSLASFEIHDYLFNLSNAMFKEDVLILGNGIRTGERLEHLENYKHESIGNWLMTLVEELGFSKGDGKIDARFENGRVEGFFAVENGKKFHHNGKDIVLEKGDEILVAILYKYFDEELKKIFSRYFNEVRLEKDKQSEYALIYCKK
jgi:hypothetical protein